MPSDDKTYCNLAVNYVCQQLGYLTLRAGRPRRIMLANEMIKAFRDRPEWAEVWATAAQKCADDGKLVVAGRMGDPHGHVAVVYPGGGLVYSGNWQEKVPTIANVGSKNFIKGCSWGFRMPPKYWVLVDDEAPPDNDKD